MMKCDCKDYMRYGVWALIVVVAGPVVWPIVGLLICIGYVTKKILDFLGVDV